MKKKMIAAGTIAGIIVIFFSGWYLMFCHFGIGPAFPFLPEKELEGEFVETGDLAENQLLALTNTEEAAEDIAVQYGIELVAYSDGVATYRTEEDPNEVIARGQENGYPQLYLNFNRTIDSGEQ